MTTRLLSIATALAYLSAGAICEAAEPKKKAAAAGEVVDATDLEALRAVLGKEATAEGTIAMQGQNRSGSIRYLNFGADQKVALGLVFFLNYSEGGSFTKEKLAEYVGKKVRVTGKIEEYKGGLQIKINKLDQIEIVEAP
jgi:DNA/RNA endonuclease YhcR with UshA esterase domain